MTQLDTLRRDLRLFSELYERTLTSSGAPSDRRETRELAALQALFAGERPFRGELLKPLSAFANLLASGKLGNEFSRSNLGDACVALGELGRSSGSCRWRFDPDLKNRTAEQLGFDRVGKGLDRVQTDNRIGWQSHAEENVRFILSALSRVQSSNVAVVVGASRSHDLPLDQLAARFARLIVVDVGDVADTHSNAARAIRDPEALRRVSVERFDLTGSYNQFVSEVSDIVSRVRNEAEAEREIDEFVSAYDVPERDVRLCGQDVEPDFVVSSMVLTQLGLPFKHFVARAFRKRGFPDERVREGVLAESLSALSCRVEQHHVAALLRIPKTSVLTSDTSEGAISLGPKGELIPLERAKPQLSARHLSDRIPSRVRPLAESAWDWLRVVPKRPGERGSLMNVEGVVLERPH
jgi:hypothetical protein